MLLSIKNKLYKNVWNVLVWNEPTNFEEKRHTKIRRIQNTKYPTHISKIIPQINKNRIEKTINENLGNDQFGLRRSLGTREAIVKLRILLEKQIRRNKNAFIAFVDLEKAFVNVQWNQLFDTLEKIGIKYNDRRCTYNLSKLY